MDIQKPDIKSLVDDISKGKIVLPDFQRDFVWKPDDVTDLLVSIFADYYIGTMLVIDDVKDEARFKLRLVQGVPEQTQVSSIVKILLDGQQRCSSIYYALMAPNLPLSGRKNPYRFYLRLDAAISDDWENCIESVNSGNRSQFDKIQQDKNFIPFTLFMETNRLVRLIQEREQNDVLPKAIEFSNQITSYQVQMVELKRETPLDRVVEVFERINRTGLPLNITDLLVARLFKSDIQLRELIEIAVELYPEVFEQNEIEIEFVLRLMCIMRGLPIKKKSILELEPENFNTDWDEACKYLSRALDRIQNVLGGYGAVDYKRFVPFKTMIIPLAAMLWHMDRERIAFDKNYAKVDQWYWVSVFGNRYNEAVNTTTFTDFERVCLWMKEEDRVPEFLVRFNVDNVDLRTASKSAATYRGVLCLIVLNGARDFQTGKDPFANKTVLEDDHIFPKSIYRDNEILNRTLIASNAEKSNKQPNQYFGALETLSSRERLEEILDTHLIDSNGYSALLANDLEQFKKARAVTIREKIRERVPAAKGLT